MLRRQQSKEKECMYDKLIRRAERLEKQSPGSKIEVLAKLKSMQHGDKHHDHNHTHDHPHEHRFHQMDSHEHHHDPQEGENEIGSDFTRHNIRQHTQTDVFLNNNGTHQIMNEDKFDDTKSQFTAFSKAVIQDHYSNI